MSFLHIHQGDLGNGTFASPRKLTQSASISINREAKIISHYLLKIVRFVLFQIKFPRLFGERETIANALFYEYVVFVVALNALRSFPVLFG